MAKEIRAKTRSNGSGSENQRSARQQIGFSRADYMPIRSQHQCIKCRSDYLRAAVDGLCQRCLQQAEFLLRESRETQELRGCPA